MQRILLNFRLAVEGVAANKLRAFLTALGIIFGVGAVIAMLAIGTGAKQVILAQMELIGANNIIIESLMPSAEAGNEESSGNAGGAEGKDLPPWSPGLTLSDVGSIERSLPTVYSISPEVIIPVDVIQSGQLSKAKCVGVTNAFFQLNNLRLESGRYFHDLHLNEGRPVCIIGSHIRKKFFSQTDPIGEQIKCGNTWLTIVGVLEKRIASEESLESLGIRDYNTDVYIPLQTALIRFQDRAYAHMKDIGRRRNEDNAEPASNYHQLDRVVVRVRQSEQLLASSNVIARILQRRHRGLVDYEINVPEKELEAQQATQETFNQVLAFIAGISLLVGGIGIMNIMLASVLERTKEIGIRRSMGAHRQDIVWQFLFEAIFISLIGGMIGIVLGVGAARFIASSYDIPTIITTWSVLLSFVVATSIGLVFGLFPAQRAARQDPIKALRTD